MRKKWKLVLGILSIIPILYIMFFVFLIIGARNGSDEFILPIYIWMLHVFIAILSFAQFIFYLIHIVKNETIMKEKKIVWIIFLYFASFITFPFYWYNYIYKDKQVKII